MLFNNSQSNLKHLTSYKSGLFAEILAVWYLRIHGYQILKTRYITGRYTGRAEIDIIAKRGNLIIFVEVKKRKDINLAFASISKTQAIRLRSAAENYLAKKRWTGDARFDVIAVCGFKIHWFKCAI